MNGLARNTYGKHMCRELQFATKEWIIQSPKPVQPWVISYRQKHILHSELFVIMLANYKTGIANEICCDLKFSNLQIKDVFLMQ